ncbi:undecaprenyldiphospho-muramoylpentapeptide beta-N-acetylglucosaminyltransferase [Desulfovibrio sp. X2]|uniref:undecaprenyldiphospho-muramoylpentapeptide beta-N-acetylglucosaminyltransferase n=1 Tax=Desulfovibrio sp. X2 TaxID=941449 RepID=UPI000550D148|nr:undecaprenyldiphospho-muramoylpentapeptide beta-N-acetylglucosaminyltransferase [Desulfovibrio sp. X2]
MKRLVLTTGGTGGHIFPALSVAEEVRRRNPEAEVLFIGGKYGPEGDLARKAGLAFEALPVRGVLGRGVAAAGAACRLAGGVFTARRLLASFRPQVVAGFGGYGGFCPVMAARTQGIPCAVHEQNSVPGAANRLLARFADKVLVTYPDEGHAFDPAKVVRTGNPVRAAIRELGSLRHERAGERLRLLVLGGSQGAMALNTMLAEAWPALYERGVIVWHQTGERDLERVRGLYGISGESAPAGARIVPFIEDMAGAYAWADLAVCRAGATTLAELTVAGTPSLLVPFPHATHDHQTVNARYLEAKGAAVLLPQAGLTAEILARTVGGIAAEPGRLEAMAEAARAEGRPDAAARVADELEKLAGKA